MTIRIVSFTNNLPCYRCDECGIEEQSQLDGIQYQLSKFELEFHDSPALLAHCLSCGNSAPRKEVIYAKLASSETIHLCAQFDGQSIASRCSTLRGDLLDDRTCRVDIISASDKLCQSCLSVHGSNFHDSRWLTNSDKGLVDEFMRCGKVLA